MSNLCYVLIETSYTKQTWLEPQMGPKPILCAPWYTITVTWCGFVVCLLGTTKTLQYYDAFFVLAILRKHKDPVSNNRGDISVIDFLC